MYYYMSALSIGSFCRANSKMNADANNRVAGQQCS